MAIIIGATHRGRRNHNEDCFLAEPALGLALVADGMGGHAGGEVASDMVKRTVAAELSAGATLAGAIRKAHSAVKSAIARGEGGEHMGSTVVAARLTGQRYELAWVGDSRCYLWNGELIQLSRDHSYVEALLQNGLISPEEAVDHPNKNLITQAVGAAQNDGLVVDELTAELGADEVLLLCSDGLNDELSDADIADILRGGASLADKVQQLVDAALAAGGHDNITAVLAAPGPADAAHAEGWRAVTRSVRQRLQTTAAALAAHHRGQLKLALLALGVIVLLWLIA